MTWYDFAAAADVALKSREEISLTSFSWKIGIERLSSSVAGTEGKSRYTWQVVIILWGAEWLEMCL